MAADLAGIELVLLVEQAYPLGGNHRTNAGDTVQSPVDDVQKRQHSPITRATDHFIFNYQRT